MRFAISFNNVSVTNCSLLFFLFFSFQKLRNCSRGSVLNHLVVIGYMGLYTNRPQKGGGACGYVG